MTPFPKPIPQKITENGQKFRVPNFPIQTELATISDGRGRKKPGRLNYMYGGSAHPTLDRVLPELYVGMIEQAVALRDY